MAYEKKQKGQRKSLAFLKEIGEFFKAIIFSENGV
jgi:hypothetical protein